jgi:PrtD family type I secretion system ABC transporter
MPQGGPTPTAHSYPAALRRLTPGLLAVAFVSAILNILMLTGSVYMLQVYDRVLGSGSIPTLLGLFLIVVLLYGFMAIYDALRARILSRGGLRLDRDLGGAAFRALWRGGADSTQGLRDIETLRSFLSGTTIGALCDLPFVPLYLGILFLIHPWLGWITVAGALIAAGLAWTTHRMAGSQTADPAERHLADAVLRQGDAILAMGMGLALTRRWRGLRDRALARGQPGQEATETLSALSRAFRMLLQSAILTMGAYLVIQGAMSGGMIIAASILSGRALAPIDQVIGQWKLIARAQEAHGRLRAAPLPAADAAAALSLPDPRGRIVLRGATRLGPERPGAERRAILSGIDLVVEPGQALAVLGPSGAGKSTLARLLVGAVPPDRGEVRLDGATFDQWDEAQLGRRIGYLPQRVEMLPGTIRDNVARFDPDIPDSAVIAAAELVGIHAMILALPQGYGTLVGAPGTEGVLSGGQMQRLGLARAICGAPALVVLDEPNANLDQAGDQALNLAVAALRAAGSSVVVMTHRPGILAEVSHLLYLQEGRVALAGPRDEILARALAPQTASQPASQAAPQAAPQPVLQPASGALDDAARAASGPVMPARRKTYGPQRRAPVLVAGTAVQPGPQPAPQQPAAPPPPARVALG